MARSPRIIARPPRPRSVRATFCKARARCLSDSASLLKIWGGGVVRIKSAERHIGDLQFLESERCRKAATHLGSVEMSGNVSLRHPRCKYLKWPSQDGADGMVLDFNRHNLLINGISFWRIEFTP